MSLPEIHRKERDMENTMTKEEAIKILENTPIAPTGGYSFDDIGEALYMAIEALQQETVSRESYDHEFNLRKTFEMQVFELEKKIADIQEKHQLSEETPTNTPTNTPTEAQRTERIMKNVTMDNPLTTQEIYDELFNFRESLKQLTDQFGELANGIMLSLAKTGSVERSEE